MTIVKQRAITSKEHFSRLGHYFQDERAIGHWSANLTSNDPFGEMDRTRELFGHNQSGRANCNTTYAYHQILSMRASDCDLNGGPMTKARCLEYLKEYVHERGYDQYEVYATLHQEHCEAEGVDRYSWHIAINRTCLGEENYGKRLCEGRSANAKISRANTVRDLDRRWSLQQVRANERNDELLPQQPSKEEKLMEKRGEKSIKQQIREAIRAHVREIARSVERNPLYELARRLRQEGIEMRLSKTGKQYQFEKGPVCVNGNRLGRGFSREGLEHALGASKEHVAEYTLRECPQLAKKLAQEQAMPAAMNQSGSSQSLAEAMSRYRTPPIEQHVAIEGAAVRELALERGLEME